MKTYQFNQATGKLHLNLEKEEYLSLDIQTKQKIKSYFLFSKTANQWVSKASNNLTNLKHILLNFGFTQEDSIGEITSFENKLTDKILKAEKRIENFETLSDRFSTQSKEQINTAINMLEVLPPGQPILVGHHSEKHHRRLIDKSDNKMRKGIELSKKSEYYSDKAKSSKNYIDESKFENVNYITENLKKYQKSLDILKNKIIYTPEIINKDAEINFRYNDYLDKISFFESRLKELTDKGKVFTKESLKDRKFIKVRGDWEIIVKLNSATVSVKTPYSWTDKIPYSKITDSK